MTRAENPPAFPNKGSCAKNDPTEGMTLRDYFAAAALQGMMASLVNNADWLRGEQCKITASAAYEMADALLAARQGGGHE